MDIAVIIGEVAFISRERIINGIVDEAKKNGDNIVLFTCEGFLYHHLKEYSHGEYNIFQLPAIENFDGVIVDLDSIENKKMQEYLYDHIKKSNVPCMSFNRELDIANEVYFDNKKGFEELLEHLIVEHKVEKFHYLSGPFGNRDAIERLEILKEKLKEHGLKIKEEDIYEGDFNFGSGKRAAKLYTTGRKKLPQAIVAANDFMAMGLLEELKSKGIRVSEDVIITGYDNCEVAAYTEPRLTTVDRGEYEAGVLAYQKLVTNYNETEEGDFQVVYGKPLYAGTCGCCLEHDQKNIDRSVVQLKMHMDESLDLIKGLTIGFAAMDKMTDYEQILEPYIEKMGMEYFYFCQCGSRESYYEELEILASGKRVKRNMTVYQDTVWCPIAYENGEWSSYPSYSRRLLFPPNARRAEKGGYYIVMPVHQGEICIGYSIIGNFHNHLSGRVLQHLILEIDGMLGNMRSNDIMSTMLAKINQKWQYDELTGLYNRSGLIQNAEKLMERAEQEQKGLSVIFFDLDGLKAVNDTQGHEAGDQYIKSMADILKENITKDDIVCRYGGDEYIVVSCQKSWEESLRKLDQLQGAIVPLVSASAGCVFGAKVTSMNELNELIEQADQKMYEYKKLKKKAR